MTGKRLLIWTGGDDRALCAAIEAVGGVQPVLAEDRSAAIELMPEADGFVTSSAMWDHAFAEALARSPRLTWIQLVNAGFDNLEALGVPTRVTVTTAGGVAAPLVAEHALALLLALVRNLPASQLAQQRRSWAHHHISAGASTLRGRRIVVIGYGNIGRTVSLLAKAFGAHVTAVARAARRGPEGVVVREFASLHGTLADADVVVICAPLTESTKGMMNAPEFAALKPGALLVNVARGPIVDTGALMHALDTGIIAGAALDVTDPEPLPPSHPLWTYRNVIITPHVASTGGGIALRREIEAVILENARRFARRERLCHTVPIRHV